MKSPSDEEVQSQLSISCHQANLPVQNFQINFYFNTNLYSYGIILNNMERLQILFLSIFSPNNTI